TCLPQSSSGFHSGCGARQCHTPSRTARMAGMLRAAVEIPFHAARLIRLARMQPIPTSLVGSYAQPDWLIDREKLRGRFPPRLRATELWRGDTESLVQGPNDGAG